MLHNHSGGSQYCYCSITVEKCDGTLTQVMMSDWLKHWQSFKTMIVRQQITRILLHMIFLPFLAIIRMVAPRTRLGQLWSAPMTKFVSHMAGYFIFIAALFLHNWLDLKHGNRGPPNTGVELYIVLFVVGKWVMTIKHVWSYGYQVSYFQPV